MVALYIAVVLALLAAAVVAAVWYAGGLRVLLTQKPMVEPRFVDAEGRHVKSLEVDTFPAEREVALVVTNLGSRPARFASVVFEVCALPFSVGVEGSQLREEAPAAGVRRLSWRSGARLVLEPRRSYPLGSVRLTFPPGADGVFRLPYVVGAQDTRPQRDELVIVRRRPQLEGR